MTKHSPTAEYEDILELSSNYTYSDYSDYYDTEVAEALQRETLHIVSIVVYTISFVFGLIGNGLVIWVTAFKIQISFKTVWFLNLAIADFVFVLLLPLSIDYVFKNFHWNFGRSFCKITSFVSLLNMFASVGFLTVISLDRYVSLVHLTWSQYRSPLNAFKLSLGVWVMAGALSSPSLYFRDTVHVGDRVMCFSNFHESDRSMAQLRHIILVCVRFVCGFLLPFITMVVTFILMVRKVRYRGLPMLSNFSKTISAVIIAFFICWTPYHVFSLMELSVHSHGSPMLHYILQTGFPLVTSLAFFNSCLNPILYVLMGKKVKAVIGKSFSVVMKNALRDRSQSGTDTEALPNSFCTETEGECIRFSSV
ncbi:chemerin-like receptor 2 [Acipenser ruthenus]|uniref:chemerin-like receptor 2 n=1 Tax=Acipenser ruthenus TaxID=7906 RepID=UPI00145B71AB|nr:chemerin-like receptor 2 [Acipenser ruthenus]